MAYHITDACVACGSCAAECPVEAISEGDDKYVINADLCIECGNCADVCPMDAPEKEQFLKHSQKWACEKRVFDFHTLSFCV